MSHYSEATIKHKLENDYGTSVVSVKEGNSDGDWVAEVAVEGGYSFAFDPTDMLRLRHLTGCGKGEYFTMHLVEKR